MFVTIKNIIPPSVNEEEKQKLPANFKADGNASVRSSHAAYNIGLGDIPQTPYKRAEDEVMLHTQAEREGQPKLVGGHVCTCS